MEFYYNFDNNSYFAMGAGYFFGYMYMDFDIYTSWVPPDHHGLSAWISFGTVFDRIYLLSVSFRYHRFFHIGHLDTMDPGLATLTNDMIFCMRFAIRLTFLKKPGRRGGMPLLN